jgi:hypothetical protein
VLNEIKEEIEDLRLEDRRHREVLARSRSASQDKNPGTDDRADAQRSQ